MEQMWWYAKGNERLGPVALADLMERLRSGELAFDTLVWTDGMAQWQRVTTVEAIRPQVLAALNARAGRAAPPPLASASPSPAAAPVQPPASPASPYAPPQAPVVREHALAPEHLYAGFWKRFAAFVIDNIVVAVPLFIFAFVFGFAEGASGGTGKVTEALTNLLSFVIGWLYFALMESSARQATLGKLALGIKVTDLEGNRISFGRATGRYFAKIVSAIILLIGYFMAGWTRRKQALHDMICGTLVVDRQAGAEELEEG